MKVSHMYETGAEYAFEEAIRAVEALIVTEANNDTNPFVLDQTVSSS